MKDGVILTEHSAKHCEVTDSSSINDLVGGWFDCVYSGDLVGFVHDEGLIQGLPLNPVATALFGSIICGPCVVLRGVSDTGENTGESYSLTENDLLRVIWLVNAYKTWFEAHATRAEFRKADSQATPAN
jgi:hypothetical protein